MFCHGSFSFLFIIAHEKSFVKKNKFKKMIKKG
nr:MAG TPA: hypothetical protein [Caudoviricetes sp.]DAS71746.1 MAG TPA: hypothetical protein [Caudoviricetes sp.]